MEWAIRRILLSHNHFYEKKTIQTVQVRAMNVVKSFAEVS
jgi:hypothetical protein